ncbi:MAG: hypothetical protein QM811_04600 [Pirellulales bacterium]
MPVPDREEFIEQSYLYRAMGERLEQALPTQDLLGTLKHEILPTGNLYLSLDYLASELKLTGFMAPAMRRLKHYFTPFQTFLIGEAERDRGRFDLTMALKILEREALYRADQPSPQGLFLYQFESLCRNRLNYDRGLAAIADDPAYDSEWRDWILLVRKQVGFLELGELIYLRSEQARLDRARHGDSEQEPPVLFGAKEGRIAVANRGREPLLLFAVLHRQLGYPEVPHPVFGDRPVDLVPTLIRRIERLEAKLKLMDDEQRGILDLTKLYAKPDKPPAFEDEPS